MKTKKMTLPWQIINGSIYNAEAVRIAVMDRTTKPNWSTPTERDAIAAYIVKACNLHSELVEALENAVMEIEAWRPKHQNAKAVLAKCKEE